MKLLVSCLLGHLSWVALLTQWKDRMFNDNVTIYCKEATMTSWMRHELRNSKMFFLQLSRSPIPSFGAESMPATATTPATPTPTPPRRTSLPSPLRPNLPSAKCLSKFHAFASHPAAPGSIPRVLEIFPRKNYHCCWANQHCWPEENEQWQENVDRIHLVLGSGKPVLQKSSRFQF